MIKSIPPDTSHIFMVGIKGAGMSALAVLLKQTGHIVTGSDSPEYFITQNKLTSHAIPWVESENGSLVTSKYSSLIYSTAYSRQIHPQIVQAAALGIPVFTYNEYIGKISRETECCCCVAGTHGKTTTSALIDNLLSGLKIPAYAIFGASQIQKQKQSYINYKQKNFKTGIIEACEYQKHFLLLHPEITVITNIDFDHPDTYKNLEEIYDTFTVFALQLPKNGYLIYCASDQGAGKVAERIIKTRSDIRTIPYGGNGAGEEDLFSLTKIVQSAGKSEFVLSCSDETLMLKIPGEHNIFNAVGAIAAAAVILSSRTGLAIQEVIPHVIETAKNQLPEFSGCDRRSEIIGDIQNIIIMDDYAHHPKEIIATLSGIREFFPNRRIVADFMPHTYSRTRALFGDFTKAFTLADSILIHPIFSSAREQQDGDSITGKDLAEAIPNAVYVRDHNEACAVACSLLQSGDLFITMGAGSNRKTAELLLERLKDQLAGAR